ncbi:hypothetical protein GMLC_10530 [Geomonas limicola]|uniref:DUF4236 domain-containing protein n=1 Tax=Geomonas limicola TaxID=2740186 RepID=A0A6V8N6C6_9BACT|nr:hypothetical protein GMLC_10530 [Geomonas limicola]
MKGLLFRKIFSTGPMRTTWTGSGMGWSIGIPGCRYGISSNGKHYLAFGIPGTGIYYRHYFRKVR